MLSETVVERRAQLIDALVRTGSGNRAAFQEVYLLTSAKLFGICLRVCGDTQAAEDTLHEVYIAVWRHAGKWDPSRGSPIAWLASIARNRAIDWRRSQGSARLTDLEDADLVVDPSPDAETILMSAQTQSLLIKCLSDLGDRRGEAIRAAFFDGVTYAELAERRGIPVGTMKSWIRRGLVQMQEELQLHGLEPRQFT